MMAAVVILLAACTVPKVTKDLETNAPPPELGRPGWIQTAAGAGAWTGGIIGGVTGVVLLPLSLPIGWLAEEPLGNSRDEVIFAPVSVGASAGHFALGAPLDMFDFILYRAWAEDFPVDKGYSWTPMKPPVGPGPADGQPPPPSDPENATANGEVDPGGPGG